MKPKIRSASPDEEHKEEVITTTEPLPDATEIGRRLGTGGIHVERLIDQGMPCIDVGIHKGPGPRRRTLRFIWADVLSWLRGRDGADR